MTLDPWKLYDWGHETDEGTWATHWVQGFAFFLIGSERSFDLGAGLAAGAFVHREISDFAKVWKQLGVRAAVRKKLLDGIGDLLFAGLGAFTGLAFRLGGPWAGAGMLALSAGVWLMMSRVAQRRRAREGG